MVEPTEYRIQNTDFEISVTVYTVQNATLLPPYRIYYHQNKGKKKHGGQTRQLELRYPAQSSLRDVPGKVGPDTVVVQHTLDRTDGADGNVLIPQFAVGEIHDVLLGDLANDALDVLGRQAAAGGDDLAANVLGNGGGSVEGEEDGGLELGLGTLDLGGGDVDAETRPLAEGEVDEVIEAGQVLGNKVNTPETIRSDTNRSVSKVNLPSVAVAGGEAHVAVGEALVVDEGAELAAEVGGVAHGTVPVADNGLGDERSEVVVILPADTLNGKGNVGRGDSVIPESDLRPDEFGGPLLLGRKGNGSGGRGLAREVTEVLLGEFDELLVGNAAGTNEDHAIGGVVGLDVFDEVLPVDGLDVLLGTEDGAAKGLALEGGSVEVVEDNLLELLINLLLLAQDHIALTLNGTGLQSRVLEDVGEDVDGLGDVGVEGFGVVDGVFPLVESVRLNRSIFDSG